MAVTNDEKDCIKLFYSPDINDTRLSVPRRAKGTFTWFTELANFKHWLTPEGPTILFLSSNPGCGKTVLCSYLTKRVKLLKPCYTVCCFFCNDRVASQRSATHVLRGLLHQLLVSHNFLVKYVLPHLETKGPAMLDELGTMMTIFEDCVMDSHLSDVVFMLDALDECEAGGRALLIKWLKRHFACLPDKSKNIKFLLTSRPETAITDILDDNTVSYICLEEAATALYLKRDIELVIRSRIESMPALKMLSAYKKRRLRARLSRNADKTFLWISLVLDSLEESFSTIYEETLAKLPTTLEGMYVKILSSISSNNRSHAKGILEILVASRRPMSLEELNACWNLTARDNSLDDLTSRLCPDMARVVSQLCGQFVRISENRCHLVHQTAKEFLLSGASPGKFMAESRWYWVSAHEAAKKLATKCIQILALGDKEDYKNRPGLSKNLSDRLVHDQDYICIKLPPHKDEPSSTIHASCLAFTQYAFRWWATHFREFEQCKEETLSTEAALTFTVVNLYRNNSSVRIQWYRKMLLLVGADMEYVETVHRVPPAIVCAYNGHISIMPSLLGNPTAINYYRSLLDFSLLHMAVLGNQEAMVNWLLDHNANTEATDAFKRTPLHLAARRNNPAILQLLVSRGANKYARDSSNKTPLYGAQELCIHDNIRILREGEAKASPDLLAIELDNMAVEIDSKILIPTTEVIARPLNHAGQIRSMLASMTLDFPAVSQPPVEGESVDSHVRTLTDYSLSLSGHSVNSSVSSEERKVVSALNMFPTAPISSAEFLSDSGSSIGSSMSTHSRRGSLTGGVSLLLTAKTKYIPDILKSFSQSPTGRDTTPDPTLSRYPPEESTAAWRTRYFESVNSASKIPNPKMDNCDQTLPVQPNGTSRTEHEHECKHCRAKFYASQLSHSVLLDQYESLDSDAPKVPSCEPCWDAYRGWRRANPPTNSSSCDEEDIVEGLLAFPITDHSSSLESMEAVPSRMVPNPPGPPGLASFRSYVSERSSIIEKKYKCKYCDKRFTQPSSLHTHKYIHTAEHVCKLLWNQCML